ncbi:MAG: hypothetical protein IT373_06590 [Polyangiaceae bacterium]|nr:hypothetical protein [Polyangiaceae bacterium]
MGLFGRDTYGAKTKIFAGGSETVLAHVGQARRRRKILGIGALVLVVVAGVATFAILRVMKAGAAERVVTGYSSLTRCLVGDAPAAGEKPSVRLRARQLTALTRNQTERAPGKDPWPDRCTKPAYALTEALRSSSLSDNKELVEATTALADLLAKKEAFFLDLSEPVDRFFAAAQKASLALVALPDVPEPPAPATALSLDTLAAQATPLAKKPQDLAKLAVELGGGAAVRVLFEGDEDEPPQLCSIGRASARCEPLPGGIGKAGGLELRGTSDDDAPSLVFVASGKQGAWRGGSKIEAKRAIAGYSSSAGPGVVLAVDEATAKLELVLGPGDKPKRIGVATPDKLTVTEAARNAVVLWNDLVVAATSKEGDLVLLGMRLAADGALGKTAEIGTLGKDARVDARATPPPRFGAACRSGEALAVRVDVGAESWLATRDADRWSAPYKIGKSGGTMTCSGADAVVTRVDAGSEGVDSTAVTQAKCGGGACKASTIKVKELLADEAGLAPAPQIVAATVGSKVAVAWLAGQRGGVRLRVESVGALAQAPETILYDDLVQGGQVVATSTVSDLRLLPGDGFGVLFVSTKGGVFAVRVTSDGKTAPIKL